MKILFWGNYNISEILTGPEKFAKRMYSCSSSSKEEFIFADYFRGRRYSLFQKIFGYRKNIDNDLIIYRLGFISGLLFLIKCKPDIVHLVTFEFIQIIVFIYKLFAEVKVFYTVHGIIFYENKHFRNNLNIYFTLKDRFMEKIIFSFADKLIFVSEQLKEMALSSFDGFPNVKAEVIPNGIDEVFFTLNNRKIDGGRLTILFVGDISRNEKGFYFLKEAIDELDLPLKVMVISESNLGGNATENSHIRYYFHKPMPTRVYSRFINNCDIYVSASSYEPFSIVLVESMAAGLVPIVTKETGASYLIKKGSNGFVINYGDKNELKKLISDLYNDSAMRKLISDNARQSVKQMKWQTVFDDYMRLYQDSINE